MKKSLREQFLIKTKRIIEIGGREKKPTDSTPPFFFTVVSYRPEYSFLCLVRQ